MASRWGRFGARRSRGLAPTRRGAAVTEKDWRAGVPGFEMSLDIQESIRGGVELRSTNIKLSINPSVSQHASKRRFGRRTWQIGANMAAARSVIVRFTSSSTSTAAPAAARLASLRQRVLQAGSGVKSQPFGNSPQRTSSPPFGTRRPNTRIVAASTSAPNDARRPTCPSGDHHRTHKRAAGRRAPPRSDDSIPSRRRRRSPP